MTHSTISVPSSFGEEPSISPALVRASLAVLILAFGFRCWQTDRVFNDTADEAVHISCGLEVLEHRRYTFEAQHPPLARVILAVPAYLAGLRHRQPALLWTGSSRESYWRTLGMARLGNLLWAPFLIVYVFLWGRRLHGPAAGIWAAALVSFCPNLLAHASLATLDFGAATMVVVSAYYFWRWSRQPGLRNCSAAALSFAIAVLTKFSALVFLPPMAALFFLIARWDSKPGAPSRRWSAALERGVLFLSWPGR